MSSSLSAAVRPRSPLIATSTLNSSPRISSVTSTAGLSPLSARRIAPLIAERSSSAASVRSTRRPRTSSASSTVTGCDRPSTRKMISLTRQKLAHLAPARAPLEPAGRRNGKRSPLLPAVVKRTLGLTASVGVLAVALTLVTEGDAMSAKRVLIIASEAVADRPAGVAEAVRCQVLAAEEVRVVAPTLTSRLQSWPRAACPRPGRLRNPLVCRALRDGRNGTRTRDLRRDRPVRDPDRASRRLGLRRAGLPERLPRLWRRERAPAIRRVRSRRRRR
jgi:hypothetical protein